MANKRSQLLDRGAETRRQPQPKRMRMLDGDPQAKRKGYKVVTISLYMPEAIWLDELSSQLQRAGIAKANRSLVVREAIAALQYELEGKGSGTSCASFWSVRLAGLRVDR